jgi:hypothetical protein
MLSYWALRKNEPSKLNRIEFSNEKCFINPKHISVDNENIIFKILGLEN